MGTEQRSTFTGRVLHETFVVDGLIGQGGMGSVYAAHNAKTPGIRYAIKFIGTDENPAQEQDVQRFRREAQALVTLDHPAIVRPIHVDVTEQGEPYLVMELVAGVSLRHKLSSVKGGLPLPFVAAVLDPIADALDHAHVSGVIHRDLKPENVVVIERGRGVQVKVLDFGIAKIFNQEQSPELVTRTSEIAGTVSYMSPEQCRDMRTAGPPSDLFTLGVMAFELLTGTRPFDATNPASTICAILLNPLPSACSERPELPAAVDDVLARACSKDPSQRYAQAGDFVHALCEAMAVRPSDLRLRGSDLPGVGSAPTLPTVPGVAATARRSSTPSEHTSDPVGLQATVNARSSHPTRHESSRPPARSTPSVEPALRTNRRPSRMLVVAIVGISAGLTAGVVVWRGRSSTARGGVAQVVNRPPCGEPVRASNPGMNDEEVCIPAGSFVMGTDPGNGEFDERPAHKVHLNAFFADVYEVSVARFRRCVTSGACDGSGLDRMGPLDDTHTYSARGRSYVQSDRCTYTRNAGTSDLKPVNCVTFAQAEQFCRFDGKHVLSEAQWERLAASSETPPRRFPWGADPPDCNHASSGAGTCGLAGPVAVGTALGDVSAEGIFDLGGNVTEWTADWYATTYYSNSPANDPKGASLVDSSSESITSHICRDGCRSTRGGNWTSPPGMQSSLRGTHRSFDAPTRRAPNIGIRCGRPGR